VFLHTLLLEQIKSNQIHTVLYKSIELDHHDGMCMVVPHQAVGRATRARLLLVIARLPCHLRDGTAPAPKGDTHIFHVSQKWISNGNFVPLSNMASQLGDNDQCVESKGPRHEIVNEQLHRVCMFWENTHDFSRLWVLNQGRGWRREECRENPIAADNDTDTAKGAFPFVIGSLLAEPIHFHASQYLRHEKLRAAKAVQDGKVAWTESKAIPEIIFPPAMLLLLLLCFNSITITATENKGSHFASHVAGHRKGNG
jgi:hypothetical protein